MTCASAERIDKSLRKEGAPLLPEKIEIADISVELLKLARSGILAEYTAESCKQAASLLEKIREAVFTHVKGNPLAMSNADAKALAENLHWIMVQQGEG